VLVAGIFAELGGRYGAPRYSSRRLRRRGHRTSRKPSRPRWRGRGCGTPAATLAAHDRPRRIGADRGQPARAQTSPLRRPTALVADTTYLRCSAGSSPRRISTCSPASRRLSVGEPARAELSGEALRGALAGASQVRGSSPLRSAASSSRRELPRVARPHRRGAEHEPQGQLLGQRGGGELLLSRWSSRWRLALPAKGYPTPSMGCSTHRGLLQREEAALPQRLSRVKRNRSRAGAHARWQHNLGVHETGQAQTLVRSLARSDLEDLPASRSRVSSRGGFRAALAVAQHSAQLKALRTLAEGRAPSTSWRLISLARVPDA